MIVFAERTELTRFAIFGFVLSLGLIVFFGFDRILWSERSERSPPGNFWVCSYFFNLVSCFYGASEASEAHLETFEFV